MRAIILSLLVLSAGLSGCLGITDDDASSDSTLGTPGWEVGDWWLYTFVTPEFGEDSAQLVVAEKNDVDENWMLAISSEKEAQRHTVINHNPFLGRVTFGDLSVFENGEAQNVFNFPWNKGDTWQFTLLGEDWNAQTSVVNGDVATVNAQSNGGHTLNYWFDSSRGFITSLEWVDDTGVKRLSMMLNSNGKNHEGQVWFIRATDLKDERYESTDSDIYDTFLDSGHPSGIDFDFLVWYLDVDISGGGGSGTLSLKDHAGATPLARTWGPNSRESGSIGTIPSNTGEYSLTITLNGQESYIHLKVAGGIQTTWTL
ncbi:MAG: hypothetical protein ACKVJ7_04205 [Candidatus Poseidoniales archaeon]|jgi:hypothetical protein